MTLLAGGDPQYHHDGDEGEFLDGQLNIQRTLHNGPLFTPAPFSVHGFL